MKTPASKDLAASVHQRLLSIARETGRPFNEVLQYFAMERLLYRLSCSPHRDSFVLKGALLFRVWDVPDSRATRDIDLLAFLDNSPESLAPIFREVCALDDDDGLLFDPDSVAARKFKEDADYEGVRVRFRGLLGKARLTMQVDVGFGDKVHPDVVCLTPARPPVPTHLGHTETPADHLPPRAGYRLRNDPTAALGRMTARAPEYGCLGRQHRIRPINHPPQALRGPVGRFFADAMLGAHGKRFRPFMRATDRRGDLIASATRERRRSDTPRCR